LKWTGVFSGTYGLLLRELRGAAVTRGAADPAVLVCCGLAVLVGPVVV
jgi:hypothetical protein